MNEKLNKYNDVVKKFSRFFKDEDIFELKSYMKSGFKILFGDGSNFGCNISYKIQDQPNGIAEAFIIGESFIGDDNVTLILGDNIFYGSNLKVKLLNAIKKPKDVYLIDLKKLSFLRVIEI